MRTAPFSCYHKDATNVSNSLAAAIHPPHITNLSSAPHSHHFLPTSSLEALQHMKRASVGLMNMPLAVSRSLTSS